MNLRRHPRGSTAEPAPADDKAAFEAFVAEVEPRLRRAYLGAVGVDRMPDAVSEALLYAWDNWTAVSAMANPAGYLFRVGQSKIRTRRQPRLFAQRVDLPDVDPDLHKALLKLPIQQRTAVWLVHACRWSQSEAAEAMDLSPSTVSTHINRALAKLRDEMGVAKDA